MSTTNLPIGAVAATAFTALLTCTASGLAADAPASFDGWQLPIDALSVLRVEGPDYPRLFAEDLQLDEKGTAQRIAVQRPVSVTLNNNGIWERMADGRMLWRLVVEAPGAQHLNVAFEDWELPPSGEAWIASADGQWVLNQITPADNVNDGELWSAIVFSDRMVIEIMVDERDRDAVIESTTLTKINVGYRGFGTGGNRGSSESCNVDVMCALGDDWWDEIPAAGVYTINGGWTCSGSMINNTNNDETPYFFTADHCGISTGNDQSVVVYWNHQNSYCRTPGSGDSGGNGNGNYNQYTSGATFLADNSTTDFTLIRMNSDPNPSWGVTFAGWSRSGSTPSLGVTIHHPNTAEKRISSAQSVYGTGQYWGVNWDQGRTYYGSSGSPLFNGSHQIVGSLCCGASFCTNDSDDYYGKSLYQSFSSMSQYLDPNNTGASSLDTYNPYDGSGNGGVCCLGSTCFSTVTEATCDSAGGTWLPDQTCSGVDCDAIGPVGACCLTSGSCLGGQTSADCAAAGGDYQGDDTNCSGVTCPQPDPTGACCLAGGSCTSDTTDADCTTSGGDYQGDDSSCDFVDCDQVDIVTFHHAITGNGRLSIDQPNWTVDVYAAVPEGFRVDAVAGNSVQQKMITSTYGFYQDALGGPTSMAINPNLYETFPDLEWDSRVTIGALDNSGGNSLQDVGIDWTNFENGGDLSVGDGTWFILPDEDQGASVSFTSQDCSQQNGVLIARLTAMDLGSTITVEALVQGRDSGGNTWQDTVEFDFTYTPTEDCNGNMISDTCDIANGTSPDANGNGIPDECDNLCPGDADGDGDADVDDLLQIIQYFGSTDPGGDLDGNGIVNVDDILILLSWYGSC